MKITKSGRSICTVEDWYMLAPPKSPDQWVDGRSAKELAKYWIERTSDTIPDQIADVIASSSEFGPILDWSAEPEVKLPFDNFKGETRNSDMLVIAQDESGPFIIGVEGKADEPFDRYLKDALSGACSRLLANPHSNGVLRIDRLIKWLFSSYRSATPQLGQVRYQLLTATAGLLAEAHRRKVKRAVLLVQEFVTDKTSDDKHALNSLDLDYFLNVLTGGAITTITSGELSATIPLSGTGSEGLVHLYISKIKHYNRT